MDTWSAIAALNGLRFACVGALGEQGWPPEGGEEDAAAHDGEGRPAFRLRPDSVATDAAGRARLVADAKWKLLDPGGAQQGIAAADVYQVVTYARRFACAKVALLYPAQQALPADTPRTYMVPGDEPVRGAMVEVGGWGREAAYPR